MHCMTLLHKEELNKANLSSNANNEETEEFCNYVDLGKFLTDKAPNVSIQSWSQPVQDLN